MSLGVTRLSNQSLLLCVSLKSLHLYSSTGLERVLNGSSTTSHHYELMISALLREAERERTTQRIHSFLHCYTQSHVQDLLHPNPCSLQLTSLFSSTLSTPLVCPPLSLLRCNVSFTSFSPPLLLPSFLRSPLVVFDSSKAGSRRANSRWTHSNTQLCHLLRSHD